MAQSRAPRNTLNRQLVIASALALADRDGLDALTVRMLATELGVRPMAIYHYVASKDELLDLLVDVVFREVYVPQRAENWRREIATRCTSMLETLARHRWALPVMETRSNPGPATLASHEAVLEVLRCSGFSLRAAAHAYATLDAFVYGFSLQETMLETVGLPDDSAQVMEAMDLGAYPRVAELAMMYAAAPHYPHRESFDVGLDAILDAVEHFPALFPDDSTSLNASRP